MFARRMFPNCVNQSVSQCPGPVVRVRRGTRDISIEYENAYEHLLVLRAQFTGR